MYQDFAKKLIQTEIHALEQLMERMGGDFDTFVAEVLKAKGKIIVSGVGKSGIIGRKIAATLSSTGSASFFLHPTEAIHGDLGIVQKEDVLIAISYSGETEELLRILPYFQENKIPIFSITGNEHSTLARQSLVTLSVGVEQEGCPLNLAPMASTTATLALGDALAVALMHAKNFQSQHFATYHPGGKLGKKLLTSVGELMRKDNLPLVFFDMPLVEVIDAMTRGRLGIAVVTQENQVVGIISDGDLRRAMERYSEKLFHLKAKDIMTANPQSIAPDAKLSLAEELMIQKKINCLLVMQGQELQGIIQLFQI